MGATGLDFETWDTTEPARTTFVSSSPVRDAISTVIGWQNCQLFPTRPRHYFSAVG